MGALSSRGWGFVAVVGLSLGTMVTAPMACFFPSYTFPTGGEGGSSSSSMGPSTSSGSMGGATTASSSSTGSSVGGGATAASSSSSSGGPPCSSQNCSDPTCAASFKCVPMTTSPTFPAGFTGYFALYDGVASSFNGCGTQFPNSQYSGNNDISTQPATCNCTCEAPAGQKCELNGPADTTMPMNPPILAGAIDAILTADAPCGGSPICSGPLLEVPTWTGTCDGYNYYGAGVSTCQPTGTEDCTQGTAPCNQSIVVDTLQVTGGSCTANAQAPTIPPVSWGTLGTACGGATPGTGCTDTTDVCMPIPQSPFVSGVCIMATGDVACSGQFSDKHTFYGSSMDSRGCTTCGCGAPTGGSCSATLTVYGNTGGALCNGTVVATLHPTSDSGDCANLTGNPEVGSKKATFSAVTGGTCASTATPTGMATAIDPTTFCCIP